MIPIHELLARIRWDAEFGRASFTLGYYDRVKQCIVTVPFARLAFEPGDHYSFVALDEDGAAHSVPYHRVREVHRDGELIWRREGPPQRGATKG